jgi:hypothetical protein
VKINKSTHLTIEQFAKVARQYCAWAEGNLGETQQEVRLTSRLGLLQPILDTFDRR